MPDFNFDPTDSDLRIGLEVEYPRCDTDDERLVSRGSSSNSLQSSHTMPSSIRGRSVYDGTVGLEIVSDVMELEDAPAWYGSVIEHLEDDYNERFQPTGLMKDGSTAGLHLHLSELSEEKARQLYSISQEPWAKVLFCSSIASDEEGLSWPVFRGGRYCRMGMGTNHYDCVNNRGGGHWEWRMPEPMVIDHIEVLVRFLRLFEQDADLAREYAQELLDNGDDRITSIRRAEKVGMDLDGVPDIYRQPHDNDPENFYDEVSSTWSLPEIYTVEMNGESFYAFQTDLRGQFRVCGIEFSHDDVLFADSLSRVTDTELRSDVVRALNNRNRGDGRRETEATNELKKIVKKKKGKA